MSDWTETFFGRDYERAYPRDHQTESQVEAAVRLLGLPPPSSAPLRILDLACGYGRHTLALRRRGYRAFGLDLSPDLLKRARADSLRGAGGEGSGDGVSWDDAPRDDVPRDDVPPPFMRADMRAVPCASNAFDAVLSLFTSFGYFEDEADDQAVLDGVARALKPGGKFLLDVLNKEWLMAHFTPRFWEEGEGGRGTEGEKGGKGEKLLNEMVFDYEKGRLLTRRTVIPEEGERRELFSSIRLYTLAETVRMLRCAGLTYRKACGDYDGRSYDMNGFRMIVIAEKA